MTRLLFVCMGNICRSPVVESVARVEFARAGIVADVASAGTENYHVGDGADPRSIASAEAAGYPLAAHRARQLKRGDFVHYDQVLAMDQVNLRAMQRLRPAADSAEPRLFLDYAGLGMREVPDPYYGTARDFLAVIALARDGVHALIARLTSAPPGAPP